MRIVLATLCLNEMHWLPALYQQHKDWPGVERWVFVEAADRVYAETNPYSTSVAGLSVDGTSSFLISLVNRSEAKVAVDAKGQVDSDPRITYIPHGFCSHPTDPAQGKCQARQRYLDVCEGMNPRPDFVIVIDADEFYPLETQIAINRLLKVAPLSSKGIVLKQRQIWCPPSYMTGGSYLFTREVVGGYWDVPHCRVWRYIPGMCYTHNHNTPDEPATSRSPGRSFKESLRRYDKLPPVTPFADGYPQCIHLGFASPLTGRLAKHRYYEARGEGRTDRRQSYVNCRRAWEDWQEGDELPHGAKVIPYIGPVPECFSHLNLAIEAITPHSKTHMESMKLQ